LEADPPCRTIGTAPPSESSVHISELDGLRAIAVTLVLLNHFGPSASVPLVWRLQAVGWVGVDLFFVLSGFLITGILVDSRRRPNYFRDFYIRRTLRIFPLYYCVLTLIVTSMLLWDGGSTYRKLVSQWGSPWWFWSYLGNIKMALNNQTPTTFALTPLWSLHIEEQFYLVFPFIVRFVRKEMLLKGLLVAIIASPVLRILLWHWNPSNPYIQYMLLPCRLDGLALGAVIAIKIRGPWKIDRRRLGAVALAALLVAYFGYKWFGGNSWLTPFTRILGYSLFSFAFASAVLWIVLFRGSWQTNWLNLGPIQFLGRISYGVYLLQAPAAAMLTALFASAEVWHNDIFRFVTISATTVLFAALSWHFLERPILQLKNRLAPQSSSDFRVGAIS
jgi:peptidoglycan/LPS O-acetylase OafA/YrhL